MAEVDATIYLKTKVADLDKADDWFEEVKELLQGHTECSMAAVSTNHEAVIEIKR